MALLPSWSFYLFFFFFFSLVKLEKIIFYSCQRYLAYFVFTKKKVSYVYNDSYSSCFQTSVVHICLVNLFGSQKDLLLHQSSEVLFFSFLCVGK